MTRKRTLSITTLALLLAGPLAAQEAAQEAAAEAAQESAGDAMQQTTAPAAQDPESEETMQETSGEASPMAADETFEETMAHDAKPPSAQHQMTPDMLQMMEAYQKAGAPGAEHQRMAEMAGTYDMTIKSWHGPGEPTTDTGTATRRMILGDRVMVEEVKSQMMGQPFTGHSMVGYDNVSDKYWATWIDSMSTGLMASEGTCDASMACTYTGTYNDAMSGQPKTVRMTSRWTDDNTEIFEMHGPGPDGKESKMMEITYRKRGS